MSEPRMRVCHLPQRSWGRSEPAPERGSGRGRIAEVNWFVARGPLPNLALTARFDLPQLRWER